MLKLWIKSKLMSLEYVIVDVIRLLHCPHYFFTYCWHRFIREWVRLLHTVENKTKSLFSIWGGAQRKISYSFGKNVKLRQNCFSATDTTLLSGKLKENHFFFGLIFFFYFSGGNCFSDRSRRRRERSVPIQHWKRRSWWSVCHRRYIIFPIIKIYVTLGTVHAKADDIAKRLRKHNLTWIFYVTSVHVNNATYVVTPLMIL